MNDPIYDLRKDVETYNTVMGRVFSASPDNIAALLDRLDKAEQENERLREDAERYRWLRGGSDIPPHSTRWARWEVRHWNGRHWLTLYAEQADDAIDAARREK